MENTVKQRLIYYLGHIKMSKSEFGRRIGVSSAFITSMRQSIQPDKIKSIAFNFPGLNIDWLMTGEGEMLKTNENSNTQSEQKEQKTIPLLPISAQGGSFDDFATSVFLHQCEKIISPIRGAELAMPVSGDSMAPEYPSGSTVLLKKINERAFIDWGRAYVLDTCNGSVIKLLFPSDSEGRVKCVSINPDYPPFDVSFEDIYGVYKVLMNMAIK